MIRELAQVEHESAQGLSPQEAFVSLLIAAARADGAVSAHEANSIENIVAGMQLFRGQSREALQSVFTAASERVRDHGAADVVRAAATVLPRGLRATAFAVAVDLMLSDGRLSPKEDAFVELLCGLLNLERDTAAKIVDVLRTKNAG